MKKVNKLVIIIAAAVCVAVGITLGLIFGLKGKDVTLLKAELASATVYEGNELDLTNGFLHYQIEDEKSKIELTSPDVSISGYDKNKKGEQTLTVEYEGESISLVVTVLPRVNVENVQTVYFVDEAFNATKGTVKVVLADGSTINVPLNDEKISVQGFNTESQSSAVELTITYTDGDFSYNNTMNIRVVEPEISLKQPNDRDYMSHETELKYNGGYIKVTVDGKTEYVDLTANGVTVEGYSPDALTIANYGEPVMQTITVSYRNRTFTYQVAVTYSDVSLIRHYASELSSLDWSGEDAPEITPEQGENALTAIKAYVGLDAEDKALITAQEKKNVLLPAVVYGFEEWKKEAIAFENTFVISGNTVVLTCESYETTKIDAEKLADTSTKIYLLGDVLATIAREFADEEIFETKVSEYLGAVYSAEALANCKEVLDYMITLYEALKDVPADWATLGTDLTQFADGFNAVLTAIKNSKFKNYESRFVYSLVSNWRTENDFAELLYAYFYGQDDDEAISKIKDVILPGILEELYVSIRSALTMTTNFSSAMNAGYISDTTEFMVLFKQSQELMVEILNLEDGNMYKDLYETLKFDGILYRGNQPISVSYSELYDFARTTSYGFVQLLHTMYGSDLYSKLWEPYLNIVTSEEEGYFGSNDYKMDVEELFRAFVESTPTEQYSFLDSLNIYYRYNANLQSPILALSTKDGYVYSVFSKIINEYYGEELDEDIYPIYEKLVTAMEYYVLQFKFADAYESFVDNILEAKAEYEALDPDKKAEFNNNVNLKFFYDKYIGYYEQDFVELDATWTAKFDELKQAYVNAYDAYVLIRNESASTNAYALFFSAYKNAEIMSKYIMTQAPEDVKKVYYYQGMPLAEGFFSYSMDSWALEFRAIYADFMVSIKLNTTDGGSRILWDAYLSETYNLDEFFVSLYELLCGYKDNDFKGVTVEEALAIMQSYNNLSTEKKTIFSYFADYYYSALGSYFDQAFTSTACKNLFNDLLTAEQKYLSYILSVGGKNEAQYKKAFKDAVEKMVNGYDGLSETEEQEFEVVKSIYSFYETKYNELT